MLTGPQSSRHQRHDNAVRWSDVQTTRRGPVLAKPQVAFAVYALIAACNASAPGASVEATSSVVVMQANFGSVAWLGDEIVATRSTPGDVRELQYLWTGRLDAELTELPWPPTPSECDSFYWHKPTALPDGRLGLQLFCFKDRERTWDIVGWTPRTTEVEILGSPGHNTHQFTWRAGHDEGWFAQGSLLCESVGAVSPDGVQHLDSVVINEDDHSFSLGDTTRILDQPGDCGGTPRSGWPDWDNDGSHAAFYVSVAAGAGVGRLDAPWAVWIYDSTTGTTLEIVPEVSTRTLSGGRRTARRLHSEVLSGVPKAPSLLTSRRGKFGVSLISRSCRWRGDQTDERSSAFGPAR